jgi:hypothetical protein
MTIIPTFPPIPQSRALFWIALATGIGSALAEAVVGWPGVMTKVLSGDHDDIMRLMQVRAWLDGQGWFDTTQRRVLPPEGISLHWSRYVDLGIAAVLVPLGQVLPMAAAEQAMLVIWPMLLMILMVTVVARGTNRMLGPLAACGAVASLITWLPTGGLYFDPGRIDHHNVQILTATVLTFAVLLPGDPLRRGVVAGLAAAFSLAVGLEMLPLILTLGLMLLVRAAWARAGADLMLAAFCVALAAGSVVLFGGQTAPGAWFQPQCDVLSTPVIALAAIASAAGVGPMLLGHRLATPLARLTASGVIAGVGIALGWPLISPCLAGPYAALPPDLQARIYSTIPEAHSARLYAARYPVSFHNFVTPAFATFAISMLFWFRQRAVAPAAETAVVGQMLIIAALGLAGSLVQIRMILLAAPAIPFLAGHAIDCLIAHRRAAPASRSSAALALGMFAMLFATQVNGPVLALVTATRGEAVAGRLYARPDESCRSPAQLARLNRLPRGIVLTSIGPAMILATHHDVIAASYHRNPVAARNAAYQLNDLAAMHRAIRTSGATYVILCRATVYGPNRHAARALLAGDLPPWLQTVPLDSPDVAVFAVVPDALASAP